MGMGMWKGLGHGHGHERMGTMGMGVGMGVGMGMGMDLGMGMGIGAHAVVFLVVLDPPSAACFCEITRILCWDSRFVGAACGATFEFSRLVRYAVGCSALGLCRCRPVTA